MSNKRQLTRAEEVRIRRRQQAQKHMTHSPIVATRPLPPVTSRGGASVATYVQPQKSSRPSTKRRYQAAFSMPGVQVRMPSISVPRFEVGWRLFSVFLSLLLGTALYLAWTQPMFQATPALVSGNQRLSTDEVNAVLNSTGQPIFTLMPQDMETRLRLNYPELASAKVTLGLPNVVNVSVVERQPIILWQQNSGYTWIDGSGVAFRPRGNADHLIIVDALAAPAPGTPSTDPLSPVPYITTDMVEAIQTLAPSVPDGSVLTYDSQNGLGWTDSRGWKAAFGADPKNMALKLRVYQSLVDSVLQRGIYPTFISVQYANAPYYRLGQ